jgi:transposase
MAKTLEKETVTAIEHAILTAQKAGKHADLHAIAGIFNCTYQSVCYIRRRIEKHQRTGIDDRKKAGRKPLAQQELMAESIRNLLAKRPELDQSAISDCLFEEFGVRVCQATISRLLKKNGIPHKISNKLYKKSKLFTTTAEGKPMPVEEDNSREVAASALSSLPNGVYGSSYKSPYPPTDMAPAVMSFKAGSNGSLENGHQASFIFNGQAASNDSHDNSQMASSIDMTFHGSPTPGTNLANYMTPYG